MNSTRAVHDPKARARRRPKSVVGNRCRHSEACWRFSHPCARIGACSGYSPIAHAESEVAK